MNSIGNGALEGLGNSKKRLKTEQLALSLFSLFLKESIYNSTCNSCSPALATKREINNIREPLQTTNPGEVKVWERWH